VLLSEKGADSTVIDAGRAGRVVTMIAIAYTAATKVQGFRIANGLQTGSAAGVYCTGAPVFFRNQIVDNLSLQNPTGGGVYADGNPVFAFNLIARDTLKVANTAGFRYGGGLYATGSGVFYQNVFEDNTVIDTACSGYRSGGALHLAGGTPLVFCNLFLRNTARMMDGSGFAYGGAVCVGTGVTAYIANNTFVGNMCAAHVPYGGAVYVPFGASVVKNNIIVNDSCLGSGGGGGIASESIATVFDYNDVWQNYPNDYYGCTAGPNALSSDPLFITGPRGDYYLNQIAAGQPEDSPCLDAGDTLLMTAPLFLDSLLHNWTTRTDTLPDTDLLDLGFHYEWMQQIGVSEEGRLPQLRPALLVSPNPCRSATTIRVLGSSFLVPRSSLSVYDASGRLLLSQPVRTSSFILRTSSFPAGVYLACLNRASARLIVER
jgi:hypothetical protein